MFSRKEKGHKRWRKPQMAGGNKKHNLMMLRILLKIVKK